MPIEALALDGPEPSADLQHATAFLGRLSAADVRKAHALLVRGNERMLAPTSA